MIKNLINRLFDPLYFPFTTPGITPFSGIVRPIARTLSIELRRPRIKSENSFFPSRPITRGESSNYVLWMSPESSRFLQLSLPYLLGWLTSASGFGPEKLSRQDHSLYYGAFPFFSKNFCYKLLFNRIAKSNSLCQGKNDIPALFLYDRTLKNSPILTVLR